MKITKLIAQFLYAQSNQEINDIVNDNLEHINANPRLFSFARNARKRIYRIQKEKRKSWELQMN